MKYTNSCKHLNKWNKLLSLPKLIINQSKYSRYYFIWFIFISMTAMNNIFVQERNKDYENLTWMNRMEIKNKEVEVRKRALIA